MGEKLVEVGGGDAGRSGGYGSVNLIARYIWKRRAVEIYDLSTSRNGKG